MEPFKNMINANVVDAIADRIDTAAPFDHKRFRKESKKPLDDLELKERVTHIATTLDECFDCEYPEALTHLCDGFESPEEFGDEMIGEMGFWPVVSFIELFGLDFPEESLDGLHHLTCFFSAEFAIRPFIETYRDLTFDRLHAWVSDPSPHVRRLVSEGSRPRLPWGMRLKSIQENPHLTLSLLDSLKDDPIEFVRRSVANHVNDHSKDHPEFVVEVAKEWWSDDANRQKLVKHGLRTLLKKGNVDALAVLGFTKPKFSDASLIVQTEEVEMGDACEFSVSLQAEKKQKWMIDYTVHHVKANGSTTPKVFKWVTRSVKRGQVVELEKVHKIKPISTRKYYSGTHFIEVMINGVSIGKEPFELTV